MKNGYEVLDVREQPEYQEMFDFAGELGEQVIDAAGNMYSGLDVHDLENLLTDLLADYWQPGAQESPKDWSPLAPREVGPEGLTLLTKALQKFELDQTDMIIRDTLTFAWEKAMLPTDNDIRDAINETKERMMQDPDLDPIWDPLLELLLEKAPFRAFSSDGEILESLLDKISWGYGMAGKPVITFNFISSSAFGVLRSVDKKVSMDEIHQELSFLMDRFMKIFWKALEEEMKNSSPDNRLEFNKQWRQELKDKKRVEAVQKELLEYLKGRRFA